MRTTDLDRVSRPFPSFIDTGAGKRAGKVAGRTKSAGETCRADCEKEAVLLSSSKKGSNLFIKGQKRGLLSAGNYFLLSETSLFISITCW
jgi:hypothetical protein